MKTTIHILTYNEAMMLPHTIAHYKKLMPNCRINVYDNCSTDTTRDIATAAGCTVVTYDTGNTLDDTAYLQIKNNCFKEGNGWHIVVDADEHLHITAQQLQDEYNKGTTLITPIGWNMVNPVDDTEIPNIRHAVRAPSYDKPCCILAHAITEMNYAPGAHHARPEGRVNHNWVPYNLYHYKYINPEYMIARHAHFGTRLSDINRRKGYGGHYLYPPDVIREEFNQARKHSIQIIQSI